jgi:ribosome-binding factor A
LARASPQSTIRNPQSAIRNPQSAIEMSRTVRLAEQIRQDLTELLARDVRDPGIGFVTLTRVRVTDDLQQARVFYTTLGEGADAQKTARALARATPYLRRALAERLRLRRAPELSFAVDVSLANQARVEELLDQIKRDDEARAAEVARETPGDDDGHQ